MRQIGVWVLMGVLGGCAGPGEEAYVEHETPEDFIVSKSRVPGIPGSFDKNHVMDDAFFTASDAVTETQVQRFLEQTPYGRRCFLADETVGGQSAAAAIVAGARSEGINPIVMLGRMQVEKSLIAKGARPSRHAVDYAFGCGCPDNRACNPAYKGLDKQIACAARTLRRHYDGSIAGTSGYVKGRGTRTLDPITVTPDNHATASLYSYTPWVLQGRGGNWLVWNVTLKFAQHFHRAGADLPEGNEASPAPTSKWVGDACAVDADCDFGGGQRGACRAGLCTVSCEGLCPDRQGQGVTFCVDGIWFGDADIGYCAQKATAANGQCGSYPGTVQKTVERFLGSSGASARTAVVCVPEDPFAAPPRAEQPAPPPAEQPPAEQPPAEQPRADPPREDPQAEAPPPAEQPPAEQPPESAGCGDLDFLGECQGAVARWCDAGRVQTRDCGADGLSCGYVDDQQGWYCQAPPRAEPVPEDDGCGGVDWFGECQGDALIWCEAGRLQRADCRDYGRACGYVDDATGYSCL